METVYDSTFICVMKVFCSNSYSFGQKYNYTLSWRASVAQTCNWQKLCEFAPFCWSS